MCCEAFVGLDLVQKALDLLIVLLMRYNTLSASVLWAHTSTMTLVDIYVHWTDSQMINNLCRHKIN